MKRVLITGAGSYIGTSVEKWLMKWSKEYQSETLDMKNPEWKKHDFSKYDVVFHVAGIAHADVEHVSEDMKNLYYKVNTALTIETAQKAKQEKVKQFILMSSMIVYGGKSYIEESTEPQPSNFYGDSKWQADLAVRKLSEKTFQVVVLRPPMIYGKGSKGNYPTLSNLAKKLPVFPAVKNKRSMLYIENLCEFVRLVIEQEMEGIFFPQNKELVDTSDLVRLIAETAGHKIRIAGWLTPFVRIGKCMPGKTGKLCKKAFGDSYYRQEMSKYSVDYQVIGLKESIQRTELK